jgi:hypothetical protein
VGVHFTRKDPVHNRTSWLKGLYYNKSLDYTMEYREEVYFTRRMRR